jgi:hypothetical protein
MIYIIYFSIWRDYQYRKAWTVTTTILICLWRSTETELIWCFKKGHKSINSSHRFYVYMALGDLAFEETGKFAGIRVLPEGKVEATYQGTGKLFGTDYSSIYTGVATPHGGTLIAEFNGICTTKEGDTVGVWAHGRGRPTGSGLKASWRGGVIWQASSQKFARLNSLPGVWELDIDEGGNFHLKVWEWK